MALISMRQMLDHAAEFEYGIPAFNVNNLEQVRAIMLAASDTDSPVIMQASAGARKYAGAPFLRHLILAAIEEFPHIPVVMHQDHGTSPTVCQRSIQLGFSSVMMDGSLMSDGKTPSSYDYNVDVTKRTVEMAHACGVSVEGELGCLGSLETGQAGEEDGVGVEVALKAINKESGLNMNGTDFIPLVIQSAINKKLPIVLWGTELEYLSKTKHIIDNKGGQVIDVMDGFQPVESYIDKLKELDVDNAIIILGMGMPKQELLAEKIKANFPKGYTIVNGGAIIDFMAGKQPRAPVLMRKLKLEFLFRLSKEPKRLFRRTVLGGIQFLFRIVLLFMYKKFKLLD